MTPVVGILSAVSTNASVYSEVCRHKQCFSGDCSCVRDPTFVGFLANSFVNPACSLTVQVSNIRQ